MHHRYVMGTIAILEDEAALRALFQRVLEREGHIVRTYANGAAALEGLLADPPSVFITDLNVPLMTGIEVVARLRQDARGQGIPCVLLSGSAEHDIVNPAGDSHFDARLIKPVDIADLVATVTDCLHVIPGRRTA